jgi:hypothetical protein
VTEEGEKENRMVSFVKNENLIKELEGKIDPCGFETVKRYFRDPNSEISQVVLVQGEHLLQEVALVFIDKSGKDKLVELLKSGAIKYGVDDLEGVTAAFKGYAVKLNSIADDQLCDVLYCPPVYLVKVTNRKWK